MTAPEALPTARLVISDPDNAGVEIFAFLGKLAAEGKRPWCEVLYPAPAHLSPEQKAAWEMRQLDAFDAVEFVGDEIVTLPPYDLDDLTKAAS